MNTDVAFNIVASWPALAATMGLVACTLLYGIGSPWWKSFLGVVFFGIFIGSIPVFGIVVYSRFLGAVTTGAPATTGDGLGVLRFIIYSFAAVWWWLMFAAILYYRSHPTAQPVVPVRRQNGGRDSAS